MPKNIKQHILTSFKGNRGFTLLELLVALTLSVMLLTILSAAIYQIGREWNSTQSKMDDQLDTTLILLQIERALIGANPYHFKDENGESKIYFLGESKQLSWVSSVGPGNRSGLTVWQLKNENEKSNGELKGGRGIYVKSVTAYVDDPEERLEDIDSHLLLEEYRFEFNFLDIDPDDNGKEEWLDEWDGFEKLSLPRGVKIIVQRRDGAGEKLIIVAAIDAWQHATIQPKREK